MLQRIVKMDGAARLLDAAIRLWFDDGDPVAVFTLEGAAFGILAGYAKNKGIKLSGLFNPDGVDPKVAKKNWDDAGKMRAFFKHANTDPDAVFYFEPEHIVWFLCNSVRQYLEITGNATLPMRALFAWMRTHHAGQFADFATTEFPVKSLKQISRGNFLKFFEGL